MKVQVPSFEQWQNNKAWSDQVQNHKQGYRIFCDGINYANDQLSIEPSTKRPFLCDFEIDTMWSTHACRQGARWARDKYEAAFVADAPNVKPQWQPVVGQKCAFWFSDSTSCDFGEYNDSNRLTYDNYALLETLDEIGKPPSYFIERGRVSE